MKLSTCRAVSVCAALSVGLIACGGGAGSSQPQSGTPATGSQATITLDGSSTVFPISEAVAEEFQKANAGTRVTVGISGTGGGFQKFCRGETDISDASRPISESERKACADAGISYIELPIAYDGIAIVANPKATWADAITTAELKTIWAPEAQGKVTRWNQVRPGWPDREIHLFGAGVDSGTYDYFTQAVVGKEGASRGDFTSSEDDNVLVQGVTGDELALGFMPFAYYGDNKERLRLVPVDDGNADNGAGPVTPSTEAIKTSRYQPLSRPVFIYVSSKALARPEVVKFMEFYVAHAGTLSEEVGYVPLGDAGYAKVAEHFAKRTTGSVFEHGGSQVGMSIEQMLSRETAK